MTFEFEYLLHLLTCGAKGTTPKPPRQHVNYDCLIQLAQEQAVLPIVGAALGSARHTAFPIEKVQALAARTRSLALTNYVKKELILKLLNDFEEAGIQAVLLKGYTLADLYAEPNCRVSSDTDIYIDIKDEKRAYKLLREHGCKVNPRSSHNHHAVCEHPQMGSIELHVLLYNDFFEFIWSGKIDERQFVAEKYETCKTAEHSYLALGKTDNLIYLALHMVKHFIFDRTNLRQMMDFALYLQYYQTQIDINRFWETLESLKCRKLVNTILNVMVTYCDFCFDNLEGFMKAEADETSVLIADLEANGFIDRVDSKRRNDACKMYSRSIYLEKNSLFSYRCYMLKRRAISYMDILFPPIKALTGQYPYIRKMKWLTPIAWIQHMLTLFQHLLRRIHGNNNAAHKNQAIHEKADRYQLFRLMHML